MNCKKNEFAVVIKGLSTGKFCTVLRLATYDEAAELGFRIDLDGPLWLTDREFLNTWGTFDPYMFDSYLRPIRPQPDDAVDEVIQRLGTPHKETA